MLSVVRSAGVPLLVLSHQLGHADPKITAQIYAHLIDDDALDQAADAFDALSVRLSAERPDRSRGAEDVSDETTSEAPRL